MIAKILIIIVLVAILLSLAASFFFLLSDKGRSKSMVNSLTVRIGLSVALFIMLFVAWYFGLLQPHPALPA